jgi:hypothetical protein
MQIEIIALIVTIALTFTGYIITYVNNLRLSRRTEQLELINTQINELYGPMFIITQTGTTLFNALRTKALISGRIFVDEDAPKSKEDVSEWQIWVENVFAPRNEELAKIIIGKAHLIREKEVPECLKKFIVHHAGYKSLIKKWEKGDYSEAISIITYPTEIISYAEKSYLELKEQQLKMIGHRKKKLLKRTAATDDHNR